MKKFYLLIIVCLLYLTSYSQISSYTFTQTNGTYQELTTNRTVLATATANTIAGSFDTANWDVTLPFAFTFGSGTHTTCNINSNGFLVFGTVTSAGTSPISAITAYDGAVAAWARDINGAFDPSFESSVSWEVIGTAPNRAFVVQYKNVRPTYSSSAITIHLMNFQIHLSEGSGEIKIVYGSNNAFAGSTTFSSTAQIGLRGSTNTDYHNRLNASTLNFNSSTQGTSNSNTQSFSTLSTSTQGMPTNGLTYTYSPPACLYKGALSVTNINIPNATLNLSVPANTAMDFFITNGPPPTSNSTPTLTVPAGGSTFPISSLLGSSIYNVYVKYSCAGMTSWVKSISFLTPCDIITGSFYENFDSTPTGGTADTDNNWPYCWSYVDEVVSTGYGYVNAVNAQSPSNSYRMYRTNTVANQGQNLRLISPETDNLGNGNWVKQVRFSVRGTSTSPQILEVFTANGTTSAANFTVLDTIIINSTTYQEYTVYLPQTTDDFFGFNLPHNGTTIAGTVHIDDVYYENTPTCKPLLSDKITISNVLKNGAAISWIDNMNLSSVSYMVEVRETGNPGDPGASFIGTTARGVTTINATALNPSTKYSVYVKVLCSATDESIWTYGGDLQTLCNYSDFVSYTPSLALCGPQKAELYAVLVDATAMAAWYDAENDTVPLFEGPDFISDTDVTQDRSFWLRSRKINTQF